MEILLQIFGRYPVISMRKISDLGIWINLSHKVDPVRFGQQIDVKRPTVSNPSVLQVQLNSIINMDKKAFVANFQNGLEHFTLAVTGIERLMHVEIWQGVWGGGLVIVSEGRVFKEGESLDQFQRSRSDD